MRFLKGALRFFGSAFIGISIILIVLALFLSQFQSQIDNLDTILDDTFTRYLEENPDEIKESLINEDEQYATYFESCESGIIPATECEISMDNPLIAENMDSAKLEFETQMLTALQPVTKYMDLIGTAFILAIVLFLLGILLLGIGVEWQLFYLIQKIFGRLAWSFGMAFAIVWYMTSKTSEDYAAIVGPMVEGAPEILITFLGVLFEELINPVFSPFYYTFLIAAIVSLALWLTFFIIRKVRDRKATKKKK